MKSDVIWHSYKLDILSEIKPALQLAVSHLPIKKDIIQNVREIRKTHVVNYYNFICRGKLFNCPALPHQVSFEKNTKDSGFPQSIRNTEALSAYVDLIQTAEYAIPLSSGEITNPLDNTIWQETQIGKKYYLLPGNIKKNVLIHLALDKKNNVYIIEKCLTVSDDKFEEFIIKRDKWKALLKEYYNVYVQ